MNLTDDEIKTLVRSLAFRNNVGRIMEQSMPIGLIDKKAGA
jgi:hypothetical protein